MSIQNPTPALSLERQVTGSNENTWGDRLNANWLRMDQTQNSLDVDVTAGDVTLTVIDSTDASADAQTRFGRIVATGNPTSINTVIWPSAIQKPYILTNNTSLSVIFKVAGQTGVYVLPGISTYAFCTTTDLIDATTRTFYGGNPGYELSSSGVIRNFGSGVSNSAGIVPVTHAYGFKANIRSFQATVIGPGFFPVFLAVAYQGNLGAANIYCSDVNSNGVQGVGVTWEAIGF